LLNKLGSSPWQMPWREVVELQIKVKALEDENERMKHMA
jgi:hypothetical protein